MERKKVRSRFAGLRISDEQSSILSQLQKNSGLSKTEILLKGLEILSEFYSLGLNQPPLSLELRSLEAEAMRHVEVLKRIRRREEAIKIMIKELRDVDEVVDRYEDDKSALIQILLEIQARNHWLSKPALLWVSERLGVPMAQICQIATFYKAFSLTPRGRHLIRVCLGTACHVRGGPRILESVERALGVKAGETTSDGKFTLETVNCLGCCALGPVIEIDSQYHGSQSPVNVKKVLSSYS